MKKVLFYADPHPVRNYFSEFYGPAMKFFEIGSNINFSDFEWKLFSNSFVLDEIAQYFSKSENHKNLSLFKSITQENTDEAISDKLIYPDDIDDIKIRNMLNEWNESEISLRNGLVLGNNALTLFYQSMLRKVYKKFQFTHVVLWSENGAVRSFCQKNNIQVLHMELGPTRSPYQETLMIDPFGTNANASLIDLKTIETQGIDSYLWASDFSKINTISTKEIYPCRGPVIKVENCSGEIYCSPDDTSYVQKLSDDQFTDNIFLIENYVIVSLQLADDLNTINHSNFNNPKDFIEEIVPSLIALGFNVCIKRHPGANQRVFNLIKEIEAIESAIKISEKIIILPASMSQKDFILFSKKAKAIISINSSVCFESWIMNIPGLIFGDSIFNFNNDLKKLSADFIQGGSLINDKAFIDSIKSRVNYSLNNYLIPNNNFVLSKSLAKIITGCSAANRQDYLIWARNNLDIIEMIMDEKIVEVSDKIGDKPGIDYYAEMAAATPNDGIYEYSIDENQIGSREFFLRGWLVSKKTQPLSVFIEYYGELFIGDMVCRDDVRKHFPYAGYNPGFEFREKISSLKNNSKSINLYIFGADKKCRYITIS